MRKSNILVIPLLISNMFFISSCKTHAERTVAQAIQECCGDAKKRIEYKLKTAGIHTNPSKISLVAIKEEKKLELWAMNLGKWSLVHAYDILGASGNSGPKLREGDYQVPEGLYKISFLNPNSLYHLSMKVSYPNTFDREQAKKENRTRLGGSIMIHGKTGSSGCLAMGDHTIEELFYLAYKIGVKNIDVIITPYDFRKKPVQIATHHPKWVNSLYHQISRELGKFVSAKT